MNVMSIPLDGTDFLTFYVNDGILSTTEGRDRLYRLVQWLLHFLSWGLSRDKQKASKGSKSCTVVSPVSTVASAANGDVCLSTNQVQKDGSNIRPPPSSATHKPGDFNERLVRRMRSLEYFVSDSRKLYRLGKFLEMWKIYATMKEPNRMIRNLRAIRIFCFFIYFGFENGAIIGRRLDLWNEYTTVIGTLRRLCYGSWMLSIFLGVLLDYLMKRGTPLHYFKSSLDFPMAVAFTFRFRIHDGVLGGLGSLSSLIGLYSHVSSNPKLLARKANTSYPPGL